MSTAEPRFARGIPDSKSDELLITPLGYIADPGNAPGARLYEGRVFAIYTNPLRYPNDLERATGCQSFLGFL